MFQRYFTFSFSAVSICLNLVALICAFTGKNYGEPASEFCAGFVVFIFSLVNVWASGSLYVSHVIQIRGDREPVTMEGNPGKFFTDISILYVIADVWMLLSLAM